MAAAAARIVLPTAAAVTAGLAYLDAKLLFGHDWKLIAGYLGIVKIERAREKNGRLNIFYTLENLALNRKRANDIFLIFEGRKWTFRQAYDIVLQYGTWLKRSYNIQPKEIVAMDFENSEKYIFLWLGLWSIGAYPAHLNYNLSGHPLIHCIKISTAKVVIVDPSFQKNITDEVRKALPGVQIDIFSSEIESEVLNLTPIREPDSSRYEDKASNTCMLQYTSGTTGLPKAAIVSLSKTIVGGLLCARMIDLKKTDIFYTCMPLYHSSAAILAFITALENGITFSLGRHFSTKTFWPEVRASSATIIQYVGETCRYLLSAAPQRDPQSGADLDKANNVRVAVGNGLRPDIWETFKERFAIEAVMEFYAATEGNFATWNFSRNSFSSGAIGRMGTIGRLLPRRTCIVKIDWATESPYRNPETGFCERVSPGTPGELLLRLDPTTANYTYQGYWNNAKASEGKLLRDVLVKGDAYMRSGDVISQSAQAGGLIYFHDRIGDTYRWKSENVSTTEVASVFGSLLSSVVSEANVYGVQIPNHDGRAGCAAIVLSEPVSEREKVMGAIAECLTKNLPRFAVPVFLRVVSEAEMRGARTGTNKQQKHGLRGEGVEPGKLGGNGEVWWLKGGRTYVRFGRGDWEDLVAGRVKL